MPYSINESTLVGICDALRKKDGTSDPIPTLEIRNRILRLGTANELNIMIERRDMGIISADAARVGDFAFYQYDTLLELNLPDAMSVGVSACAAADMLEVVTLDKCELIKQSAFYGCKSLRKVYAPRLKTIETSAFSGCKQAEFEINFSDFTAIPGTAFYNCEKLDAAICPNVTEVEGSAFRGCTALAEISFPVATVLWAGAFRACSSLQLAIFPAVETVSDAVFYDCTNLVYLDFHVVKSFGITAFNRCSSMVALVLRNTEAMATLSHTSDMLGSSFWSGSGYIYVPRALLETYRADSLWIAAVASTDQIQPLEDYTVDGTVTGPLDPDKVAGLGSEDSAVLGKAVLGKMILGKE